MAYLRRRAWRYLRRTAQTRPACYGRHGADVLAHYEDWTSWNGTWVANHILHHETRLQPVPLPFQKTPSGLNDRAYAALWRRSPRRSSGCWSGPDGLGAGSFSPPRR